MGSSALMVWVKETATEPRLMLVSVLPSVCTAASGEMDTACRNGAGEAMSRLVVSGFSSQWSLVLPASASVQRGQRQQQRHAQQA